MAINSTDFEGSAIAEAVVPAASAHMKPKFIVAGVLGFFTLLTIATLWIAAAMVERAVERDASRRSLEWAEFAVRQAPQIAALAVGLPMNSENWETFQELANFGGVFRFKIFSPDGVLRFESDDPTVTGESLGKHNTTAATVVNSGQAYTILEDGRTKSNRPDLYSETYLPVYDNGRLVAIAETYMDQTSKAAAVRVEYAFVGAAMTGMILLALLVPSSGLWVMFRRFKLNNIELKRSQARAQASDKIKGEFIATVSHELRTPLTSIKGSLEMLKSGRIIELTGTAARLVAMAARNANILNLLVNDLLDFERMDSGNLEITKQPTDIVAIVKDEIDTIKSYVTEQEVEYRYSGDIGPLIAHADPDRIAQVVRNLLSNAVKFSPVGGKVEVSVEEKDESVRVEIRDMGCGISEVDQGRIFEKFIQVDSSNTRKYGGTGLGLAISKEIIKAHNGDIGVTSIEGQGSIFYFDLPIGIEEPDVFDVPLRSVA